MSTHIRPANMLPDPSIADAPNIDDIDALLKEYMAFTSDALDILVTLYGLADSDQSVPAEVTEFSDRLSAWDDHLSAVIARLATGRGSRVA